MSEQNTVNSHGNVYAALAAISRDAGAIGKDSKNTQQGFAFRGIDAVMNHLHPLFARHGVVILPEVIGERTEDRETKSGAHLIYRVLTIKVRFAHESGSDASCVVIGEGMDSGDKASNKAMAVGLKYALTQMLLLPYDEVDPDADTPPDSKPQAQAQPAAERDPWEDNLDMTPPAKPAPEPPSDGGGYHKPVPPPQANTHLVAVVLEAVKTQTGKSAKGPWKRTYAKGNDGEWYQTFNAKIADAMYNLQGAEASLIYKLEKSEKGESRSVVSIAPVQA